MVRAVAAKSGASEPAFARTAQRRVSPNVFGKMADARGFVPALGDQATAQVDGPAQTQSLGNFSEPLSTRREEPAQQPAAT